MSGRECAHAACSCPVEHEEIYCAPTCRESARRDIETSRGCACGHQECLGEAGRRGPPALESGRFPPDADGA